MCFGEAMKKEEMNGAMKKEEMKVMFL